MKRFTLLLLSLLSLAPLMSQNRQGGINLKIKNAKDMSGVLGATVIVMSSDNRVFYTTSGADGAARLAPLDYGNYELMATYVGCDTLRQSVVLDRALVDLGDLTMREISTKIDRVTVMANAIRTSQSGDTVSYNADAFKVTADAVAEGLLAKMPGITVDEDGEVEAQGEQVKKVYLDGKEFFGEDVTIAMKNIPADIIARVEVFNKLSDSAEFSGFDDGNGYKAINIVTKTGTSKGQFGKFTAGYAYEDLYQLSGNYNYFTGNHRFSVIAMSNNMNIKNFGSQDLVGGGGGGGGGRSSVGGSSSFLGGSSGISTVSGIGLNYGGQFLDSKLKLEASYFFNDSENETETDTDRQYLTDSESLSRYFLQDKSTTTDNLNHRFNGRVEYKPSDRHMFMMRPEFAYQDNSVVKITSEDTDEALDGGSLVDLSNTESYVVTDKDAFNVSNNMVYRALLGNKGRNIMISANGTYSQNNSYSLSDYLTSYADGSDDEITKQNIINDTESYNISANFTYSEPILEKKAMLTMRYNFSYKYSDADYMVYEWEQEQNMFNPEYDETSSNIYNSGYMTHEVGPGFMYSNPNSLQMNANIGYQRSTLANEQMVPVTDPADQRYVFDNVVYSLMMRKTFNPTNTLRLMLRSNTENPSVSELQDVVKDSDPTSVTSGNPDLEPSYSNSLRATYVRTNVTKGTTFMASMSGSYKLNSICDATIMLLTADDEYLLPNGNYLDSYGQYSYPVNMDGEWSATASVSYGTPINPIRSNLNMDVGYNYSETPSIYNEVENMNMKSVYSAGLTLGSNISQSVDFTLGYNIGYNVSDYRYDAGTTTTQNSEYMTHKSTMTFKFVLWGGLTLSSTSSYSIYSGLTEDFWEDYLIANLYLGKKLFKNNRGEISLGVEDLFDQNENFARNVTESYIENVTSNTIGRYFGVKLTYDLRKFDGQSLPERRRPEGEGGMGRGMGRPEGGGMGGRGGMGGGPGGGMGGMGGGGFGGGM